MNDSLQLLVAELRARVDKEITRIEESPHTTESVGGLTKLGRIVEDVAKLMAANVCTQQGLSLQSELRRRNVKAGAGSYLVLLSELLGRMTPNELLLAALVRDARHETSSRLHALIKLRNANAHPGTALDPNEALRTLKNAKSWMATLPG